MTLNPFVFGTTKAPECFDEKSPCLLEQTSMCVIKLATEKAIASGSNEMFPGQSEYVPWLVCMDSNGDPTSKCDSQVGVSTASVDQCLNGGEAKQLLAEYMKTDAPINSTPTVHVNGKNVKTTYRAIRDAFCDADPTLKGCSMPLPETADLDVPKSVIPPRDIVV